MHHGEAVSVSLSAVGARPVPGPVLGQFFVHCFGGLRPLRIRRHRGGQSTQGDECGQLDPGGGRYNRRPSATGIGKGSLRPGSDPGRRGEVSRPDHCGRRRSSRLPVASAAANTASPLTPPINVPRPTARPPRAGRAPTGRPARRVRCRDRGTRASSASTGSSAGPATSPVR